jgi:hypothetical protein
LRVCGGGVIQRPRHQFLHQPVGHRDVITRGFHIRNTLRRMHRPLLLMQQCNGGNQRQVLAVITPHACALIGKRQLQRIRIHHEQRL